MSMTRLVAAFFLSVSVLATPTLAQHRRDQDAAREAYRAGQVKSLREIEQKVLPRMPGADYLGPEYDPASSVYRLKFMRAGQVIWIDVDARTLRHLARRRPSKAALREQRARRLQDLRAAVATRAASSPRARRGA